MNIDAIDGIASLREDGISDSLARICCDLVEREAIEHGDRNAHIDRVARDLAHTHALLILFGAEEGKDARAGLTYDRNLLQHPERKRNDGI